jgi:hypothetical protein
VFFDFLFLKFQPRGSSFQDAKLQFADVQLALKEASGTVVFNSAGKTFCRIYQLYTALVGFVTESEARDNFHSTNIFLK